MITLLALLSAPSFAVDPAECMAFQNICSGAGCAHPTLQEAVDDHPSAGGVLCLTVTQPLTGPLHVDDVEVVIFADADLTLSEPGDAGLVVGEGDEGAVWLAPGNDGVSVEVVGAPGVPAIALGDAEVHLVDVVVRGASTWRPTGGVITLADESELYVHGGEVSGGVAQDGGLIWAAAGSELELLDGVELHDGFAVGDGGLVFTQGKLTVDGARFGRSSTGCEAAGGYGGAIYLFEAPTAHVEGARIEHCRAEKGGAIAVSGGALVMEGSTVRATTAELAGGAVYGTDEADITIRYSVLDEALSDAGFGDAVYVDSGQKLDMVGSAVCSDDVLTFSGVEVDRLTEEARLSNMLFQGDFLLGAVVASGPTPVDVFVHQASFLDQGAFPVDDFGISTIELTRSVIEYVDPFASSVPAAAELNECLVEGPGPAPYGASYVRGDVGLLSDAVLDPAMLPCGREFRIHPLLVPAGVPNYDAPTDPAQHLGVFGYSLYSDFDPERIAGGDGLDWYEDEDGDGFPLAVDCNDVDPYRYPGAVDVCGAGDEDCDGDVDEDPDEMWILDADGDGWGWPGTEVASCGPPAEPGYIPAVTSEGFDCDDSEGAVYPDAVELCRSGLDENCDGTTDEGASWVLDEDGDGHLAKKAPTVQACDEPADPNGGVWRLDDGSWPDDDCDDDDAAVQGPGVYVPDLDGDGYTTDVDVALTACAEDVPDGWVLDSEVLGEGDCNDDPDDRGALQTPGAAEVCGDMLDNNCEDGLDDEEPAVWYEDGDGDGYLGDSPRERTSCVEPEEGDWYLEDEVPGDDCNDADPTIHPDADDEPCDGVDSNCDDAVEADGPSDWVRDADGDGYLSDDPETFTGCSVEGEGWVLVGEGLDGDCDDDDDLVYPGAEERCNGIDDDCDGFDDDAPPAGADGAVEAYPDVDLDGYGSADGLARWVCLNDGVLPRDMSEDASDCDDTDYWVNPGGTEVAGNEVDENCDGYYGDAWVQGGCSVVGGPRGLGGAFVAAGLMGWRRRR